MLKINMELIKRRKRNSRVRSIGAHFFSGSSKNEKFSFFENFIFYFDFVYFSGIYFFKRHSTSPPCGNQVDGLPHDVHTETVSIWTRVRLRTQILWTLKYMF